MSNYNSTHTGAQLDEAISAVLEGGTLSSQVATNTSDISDLQDRVGTAIKDVAGLELGLDRINELCVRSFEVFQGGYTNGKMDARLNRIRVGLIKCDKISVNGITGIQYAYTLYDADCTYVSQSNFVNSISNLSTNGGYVSLSMRAPDNSDITPEYVGGKISVEVSNFLETKTYPSQIDSMNVPNSPFTVGFIFYDSAQKKLKRVVNTHGGTIELSMPIGALYSCKGEIYQWNGSELVAERVSYDKFALTIINVVAGYFNQQGNDFASEQSVRDDTFYQLPEGKWEIDNKESYRVMTVFYDSEKTYVSGGGSWRNGLKSFTMPENAVYVKFAFNTTQGLNPSNYNPVRITQWHYDGLPEGGAEGDVLTPEGWSGDYATKEYVDDEVDELVTKGELSENVAEINSRFDNYETSADIRDTLTEYLKKNEEVGNIADGSVTLPTLSQSVRDLINSSGGGTITNFPDDIDLEVDANNRLHLKGGGVVRFRVKSTSASNYDELLRCIATGLPIQIEDVVDFAHSDGSIRVLNVSGARFVFVGHGMIKNCRIVGKIYITAGLNQIFDNVYFHLWSINGTTQINSISLYDTLLASNLYDVYNRKSKELKSSDSTPVNMFDCSFTKYKIGNFQSPVLSAGKYVYQENGQTVLTFEDDGEGNIKIPIRKDYLFLSNDEVVESVYDIRNKTASYVYAPASNLLITRLYAPKIAKSGYIAGTVYPEWWGATSSSEHDSADAIQWSLVHGGEIRLSADYYVIGGLRVFGNTLVYGNSHTLNMIPNSSKESMFEIESVSGSQRGIVIYDLNLDGNKNYQNVTQDGIYCDFRFGLQPFSSYGMDNTYWYNLKVQNFTGCGICVAVPGTSHIYSSYLAYNGIDGITWDNEHFTLVNVTCWNNGRHGAYASGNHWRIIGGAYAHNDAGDNIHCDGAFQSQIIGCSTIDSGKFVEQAGGGYAASSLNPYGYIWVGEGNGTHELVGGNGINMQGCYDMTLVAVRVNNQNANGILINGGHDISLADCQLNSNNSARKDFKDINSNVTTTYICNTKHDGIFVSHNKISTAPKRFGTTTGEANWNDLLNSLPIGGEGVTTVVDFYNAQNRPSGAGTYLEGTITCKYGLTNTVYRTYVRMMDENGNIYTRYFNVNVSSGVYTNDTGWKKITATQI